MAAWGSGLRRVLGSHLGSAGSSAVTDEQCLLWTRKEGVVAGVPGICCSRAWAVQQGDCLRKSQGQEGGVAPETEKGRTGYLFFLTSPIVQFCLVKETCSGGICQTDHVKQ